MDGGFILYMAKIRRYSSIDAFCLMSPNFIGEAPVAVSSLVCLHFSFIHPTSTTTCSALSFITYEHRHAEHIETVSTAYTLHAVPNLLSVNTFQTYRTYLLVCYR